MLEYDLTNTSLFDRDSHAMLPTEQETFAITVALLLVYDAPYCELGHGGLELTADSVEAIAVCLEERLTPLVRDIEHGGHRLRERLRDFVGLRISHLPTWGTHECPGVQ